MLNNPLREEVIKVYISAPLYEILLQTTQLEQETFSTDEPGLKSDVIVPKSR